MIVTRPDKIQMLLDCIYKALEPAAKETTRLEILCAISELTMRTVSTSIMQEDLEAQAVMRAMLSRGLLNIDLAQREITGCH